MISFKIECIFYHLPELLCRHWNGEKSHFHTPTTRGNSGLPYALHGSHLSGSLVLPTAWHQLSHPHLWPLPYNHAEYTAHGLWKAYFWLVTPMECKLQGIINGGCFCSSPLSSQVWGSGYWAMLAIVWICLVLLISIQRQKWENWKYYYFMYFEQGQYEGFDSSDPPSNHQHKKMRPHWQF